MREKMKTIRNRVAVFGLAVVCSLFVHVVVLAGLRGFAFPKAPGPGIFLTAIITRAPSLQSSLETAEGTGTGNGGGNDRGDGHRKYAEGTGVPVPAEGGKEREGGEGEESRAKRFPAAGAPRDEHCVMTQQESPEGARPSATAVPEKEPVRTGQTEGIPPKSFRERLTFDLYWLGIYVGNAALEAVTEDNVTTITTEAHSAPFISNFYKVEDHSESRVVDGMPSSFRIRQHEGKYRSDKETRFDVKGRKVVYFDYLKDLRNEQEFDLPRLWDVVSGFYYLRTQQLEVGRTVYVDVFDSDKFLRVEVDVVKKDRVRVPGRGDVDAIVINPLLKSEGLFQNKGNVLVWLTDDESKTPVRVETEVPVGKVVAKLRGIETERGDPGKSDRVSISSASFLSP
jgi:hypothetical protein